MKAYQLIFFILFNFPALIFAQTPAKQKLQAYTILDKGDSVSFYIYTVDNKPKEKVFLYLQGSGNLPIVYGDEAEPCCYNSYPKKLMTEFPEDYAFVYIQKVGLPYYVRNIESYEPSPTFTRRNNVIDRAEVANKVIDYIKNKIYPNAKTIAVLGHSEGSDVVAKLATLNKNVTHICFSAGNATPQIFNDVLFTRREMQNGKISAEEAQKRIGELMQGYNKIYQNPSSINESFNGDSYKWHAAINHPPIDNLLKLKIPIFLTIGSHDDKVPIEASDLIEIEFIRHQKNNLKTKVYANCNHNFEEIKEDGSKINHWKEMFFDFLDFVKKNPR